MGLNAFQLSLCITLLDTAPTKEDDLAQAAWHAATNDFRLFGMPSESQLVAAKHYSCYELVIRTLKRTCVEFLFFLPALLAKPTERFWYMLQLKKQKNKSPSKSMLALHPIFVGKANGKISFLTRCRGRGNVPQLG